MTDATQTPTRKFGFESSWPVAVSQTGPRPQDWGLTHELVFRARDGRVFRVPVGQRTDFASVPSILTWLVSVTTGIAAAILHDHFWRVLVPAGVLTYREADALLREALRTLPAGSKRHPERPVPTVRCWLMWAAVRWGALTRPGGRSGWWRDAPAVLGISLLALPFAVASLVLLPFIAVFKAIEWVIG